MDEIGLRVIFSHPFKKCVFRYGPKEFARPVYEGVVHWAKVLNYNI